MQKREIKHVNEQAINVELEGLNKLIKLVKQQDEILAKENCTSLAELEFKLVENSPFTSVKLAVLDAGKEDVLDRLYAIEKELGGRLVADDLTSSYTLKNNVIESVRERHTTYFTDEELTAKKQLDKVIKTFNDLPHSERVKVLLNRTDELVRNPFLNRFWR